MTDTDVYIEAVRTSRNRERSRRTMPVYRCFVEVLYCHESTVWPSVRAVGDAFSWLLNTDSSIEAQKETRKKEQAFTYVHSI